MNNFLLNFDSYEPKNKKNISYKFNKNTFVIMTFGVLFKFILDYAYAVPLQINFSGEMFELNITYFKLFMSYIITFIQFYFLPKKNDSVCVFILIILMYIMVPVSTIYSLKNESTVFYFLTSVLFILFEIISNNINIPKNSFTTYKISGFIEFFLYFVTFLVYLYMFILKGIPTLEAFNLYNIYQLRKINALLNNKYLYYFIGYQAYTINPILITINYINKQYIKMFIITVLQIFLFLWLGHKYMLFILFVLYTICLLSKYRHKQKIIVSLFSFSVLWIALIKTVFLNNRSIDMLFSMFIRRALFVPAVLKFNYYDFFIRNDTMGLWGTIIAPLFGAACFRPPYYPVPVTKVIGEIYAGGSNANTGLWAAEIMHFGLTGVFVTFFCLLVFIYVIKISEKRNGTKFTFIVGFTSVMGLNDAGIINIFTISPILFTLIFLSIYSFKYKPHENNKRCCSYRV